MRYYRRDVADSLGDQKMRIDHGFLFFAALPSLVTSVDTIRMSVSNSYVANEKEFPLTNTNTMQLLDNAIELLHHSSQEYPPILATEKFFTLFEEQVDSAWKHIVSDHLDYWITNVGVDEQFTPAFSVITVLFRSHNLLAAQSVLLFKALQEKGAEIIICNNSPDISTSLHQQLKILNQVYGVGFTIVNMDHNVGFSRANNIGAKVSRSNNLLFINPDVIPRTEQGVENLASAAISVGERSLVGGILYYGDGSIMHGGMAILEDDSPETTYAKGAGHFSKILRVDHYLKGAPKEILRDLIEPIPVQAVTGALMIICKEYFQKLGGFAEDYLFGHYEDADLCMRIWQDKGEVLLDTRVRLYHFEGQGAGSSASYMRHAQHLNRLKFTKKWINDHTHITANATDVQKMITESRGVIEQ
jgi:GT2 family glycosyltransferase